MSKTLPIILDVDTGIDDGVSLMMAVLSKKLDTKLIVTCHGNTTLENITKNTLSILETLGVSNIPVAEGLACPLIEERPHEFAHGLDGLGGYTITNPTYKKSSLTALEATHQLLSSSAEPITYICVSPVTNLAKLIQTYPEDISKIKEAIIMVGSNQPLKVGEIPYKEFNASVDPEALEIVMSSSIPKVIISMEMGHTAYLNWQDVFKTKVTNEFGSILERIYRKYNDYHVQNGIATHDSCAIAYAIDPTMFSVSSANLKVQYFKELESGVGIVDYNKQPNCLITTKINVKKYKKLYFKYLKLCKVNKNIKYDFVYQD